jgi:hypothetical protein
MPSRYGQYLCIKRHLEDALGERVSMRRAMRAYNRGWRCSANGNLYKVTNYSRRIGRRT